MQLRTIAKMKKYYRIIRKVVDILHGVQRIKNANLLIFDTYSWALVIGFVIMNLHENVEQWQEQFLQWKKIGFKYTY